MSKAIRLFVKFVTTLFPSLRWKLTPMGVRRFLNLPPAGFVFIEGKLHKLTSRSEEAFKRQNRQAQKRSLYLVKPDTMDLNEED